jgi:hypothetical protein
MKTIVIAALLIAVPHAPALAWGGTGHRMIGELAIKNLPATLPAFLRTPQARAQIGLMAQEPDISRGAGQPHDGDSDPGHFVDVADDGTILGGPTLATLPAMRRDYDTALRAANTNEYVAGFLPYNIMGGWQQLVKDFALLRRDMAAQKYARKFRMTAQEQAAFARQRAVRELLTLRDLGVWAHYIGDASQPMHVSVHYDGWGDFPNPNGYPTAKGLHAKFEADFVNANIIDADVAARIKPYRPCDCTIQRWTQDYLSASLAQLIPMFDLAKQGAFDTATPQAKAFTAERLAVAATMLRDMVADAWTESGKATLGYKTKMTVAELEAGTADPRKLE